ncbi:putative uncharacterized protein [Firmicutes bacterium CAG:238]|nr:putative uncharacterized protein [Firmicutes bacterium CAG:238]
MSKRIKKAFAILMALVMVFAMSTTAFALADDSAKYTQAAKDNAPTVTGEFTVYLSISSNQVNGKYINDYKIPVTMGAAGVTKAYFVKDVILAAMNQAGFPYAFKSKKAGEIVDFNADSDYVYGIACTDSEGTTLFEPVTDYNNYNGWMFRIDDRYPMLNSADWPSGWTSAKGPCGASIEQAYVKAGQTISFYFSDTASADNATRFLKIKSKAYTEATSKLTINIKTSYSYYRDSDWYWFVYDFTNAAAGNTMTVKVNGTSYEATTSSGKIIIQNFTLASGTNTIEIMPIFNASGIPTFSGAYYTWTN